MRITLLAAGLASLVALAGAGACGGAVVIDGPAGGDEGSGGTGGAASTASGPGFPSSAAGPQPSTTGAGPQTSGSGGAAPVEEQTASCDAFCALFDRACPANGCRDACAALLTVPHPCNPLTTPYFDCMSTSIQISSMTSCAQIARWLDPLFECLGSSESACDTSFKYACLEPFEAHRACQLGRAP
ncbi:hypothetical protein WMF18_04675 [Sorangium sp. So ce315]|uniref:hypothetical protein n=1 Tax=Sorangium sp. So ce315 TaxID=3133299 RepID=UPI003F5FD2FE